MQPTVCAERLLPSPRTAKETIGFLPVAVIKYPGEKGERLIFA